jgi:hypothetical protein
MKLTLTLAIAVAGIVRSHRSQSLQSPTQQSLGESPISSITLPAGTYTIPSFFDVFVEISLDSGSSWIPSTPLTPYNLSTPEPGTWLLAGTALVGLIRKRRR